MPISATAAGYPPARLTIRALGGTAIRCARDSGSHVCKSSKSENRVALDSGSARGTWVDLIRFGTARPTPAAAGPAVDSTTSAREYEDDVNRTCE
jgi:hypothetical protein